ncbi:MAG: hypothetical protein KKA07_08705 [Bacteroidetes bacterium]|nr:hypothetical protein [Bacteroidota bacterium]MBU1719141.1 hypothetical protein [Bacteroidota bacterium]
MKSERDTDLLNYDVKVLLAVYEALDGKEKFFNFLLKNFPELAAFVTTIYDNSHNAYKWLVKNDFRTLAAMLDAMEENNDAFQYLQRADEKTMCFVVKAALGDKRSYDWLVENAKVLAMIASKIRIIFDTRKRDKKDIFTKFYNFTVGSYKK